MHEEPRLHRFINGIVEKRVLDLSEKTKDKASDGLFTKFYQTLEQYDAKAIYLEGADGLVNIKIWKVAESQDFMQNRTNQHVQSPLDMASVTDVVKQHAENAVAGEAKYLYHKSKQELVYEQ